MEGGLSDYTGATRTRDGTLDRSEVELVESEKRQERGEKLSLDESGVDIWSFASRPLPE